MHQTSAKFGSVVEDFFSVHNAHVLEHQDLGNTRS